MHKVIRIFIAIGCGSLSILSGNSAAQNPKIKCYFNHPVNTAISTGQNAIYLNGTFDDTVVAYINRAKYTVDIAQYDYTSTAGSQVAIIATAANNAAARGVIVRWIYNGSSTNSGLSLLSATIKTLGSPTGGSYGIMHNKFMIIDANSATSSDAILMTASYDWSTQQTNTDYNNIVVIQDQPLSIAYYNEFNKMWGGTGPAPNPPTEAFGTHKTPSTQNIFNVNGTTVELYFSPKDSAGIHLKNAIRTADDDLFFGIYTFTDTSIANLVALKYNNSISIRGLMDSFSVTYTNSLNTPYHILAPLLGSNMIVNPGSGQYHNKIMIIDGLNPQSDPQVCTGSFNWSGAAQTSNDENLIIIHDPSVTNQYYQSLCQNFTDMGGAPCIAAPCPNGPTVLVSDLTGPSYQWQLNNGSGFNNITNNANYAGTTTQTLIITGAPTIWYGYQYRCFVNGTYSDTTALNFTSYWNGSVSIAWENAANWNCGIIPDANTDVVINNGTPFAPLVSSQAFCRSLKINPGTTCNVATGFKLTITH